MRPAELNQRILSRFQPIRKAYEDFIKRHPDHAKAEEWLDDYDPDQIDELPIKYALSRIANQRNAARARLAK